MVQLPEFVTEAHVREAKTEATKHTETAQQVTFETFEDGRCVQLLHRGPYSSEPETLARLDAFIETENLSRNGSHHENYLTDPRKCAPEKMRTILREPVR